MAYSNGDVYCGDWVENRREGRGTLTQGDGEVFGGELFCFNKLTICVACVFVQFDLFILLLVLLLNSFFSQVCGIMTNSTLLKAQL